MTTIPDALTIAIQNHQSGRLQAAERIYRRILQVEPNNVDAIHFLGVIASQVARLDEAIACYRRALELKPDYVGALNNLGNALKGQGKLDEAIDCYRWALKLQPDYAEGHNNLGNALKLRGKLNEAVACFRRALELMPDYADANHNLGNALQDQGKTDEAVECYRRALELKPGYAETHNNLGVTLKDLGKTDEAVDCFRRALELKPDNAGVYNNLRNALTIQAKLDEAVACFLRALELKPDYADAHNNLGNTWNALGKLDEAVLFYRRALELKPGVAEIHSNLGAALKNLGKLNEAVASFRRALELMPDYADANTNLGIALRDQGKMDEAVACFRRALEEKPDNAEAHNNLGAALKDQGKTEDAVACYRRALELKPDYAGAHSNLLQALHYRTGVTLAALAEAHAEYDRQHAAALLAGSQRHANDRDRHGQPRLGFVSADLGRHPIGYFLIRVFENLDQRQFETICYSDRIVKDDLTHRFQAAATGWRDVVRMSDERLAEHIRADGIDILFDLAGHTGRNRLLVFARKPAPIQVTWIGYEGTTGLAAMDYLVADHFMIPHGSERHYRESVLRMPGGYLCYDPPAIAPPVGPPPSLKNRFATFGSFNNLAKITPEVVSVWAEILRGAQTSRLIMKYRGLGDQTVKERYLDLFTTHGVEPSRLELLPWTSYTDYLETYQHVDVTLDPFPFSGSTITCESLWMGVPVVTCPRETFASRHSLHHLSSVGLTTTIAQNLDDYVKVALSLAGDVQRLAALRAELRTRMAASPLCDGQRFAADFASMLYDIWKQ